MMIAHERAHVLFMFAETGSGECTDKTEKTQFFLFGFAEPNPILCRDNPILCKDKDKILFQYNKKVKNSTLPLIRSRLPLCIPICDKKFVISVVFCITFASNLQ